MSPDPLLDIVFEVHRPVLSISTEQLVSHTLLVLPNLF